MHRPRPRADVLAHHHRVEAGRLGLDGRPDERAKVAGRNERPVLGEDEDEARPAAPPRPLEHAPVYRRRSASASLAGSRP